MIILSRNSSILFAFAMLLFACSAPQDDGGGEGTPMMSKVVDGYLAYAIVYHDINQNGEKDTTPAEPSAITDGDGYISYNPLTETNYCEDPTAAVYRHCLSLNPAEDGEVVIRMLGGYDVINAVPFMGAMSLVADVNSITPSNIPVASPLSSLMEKMTSSQKATFLTNESLTETSAGSDYIEFTQTVGATGTAQDVVVGKLALKLHKIVDVINEGLKLRFDGASGLPDDLSHHVYKALILLLVDTNSGASDADTLLANSTNIDSLIALAINFVEAGGYTQTATDPTSTRIRDQLAEVVSTVDNAFAQVNNTTPTIAQMKGAMRAIEVTTALARDYSDSSGTYIADKVNKATTIANNATFIADLGDDAKADLTVLVNKITNDPGGFDTATPTNNLVTRKEFTELSPGGTLIGRRLSLTDPDTPSEQVTMDFVGSTGATEGDVTISPPDAEPVSATWQMMDDYALLIEVPGVDTMMVKPVTEDGTNFTYLFDFNNEIVEWDVPAGETGFSLTP
jgi:hypothetical protein